MGFPHQDLAALIEALPEAGGFNVSENWPSTVASPAVNVRVVRRTHVPICRVEWEMEVDVVISLSSDQNLVHVLTEAIATAKLPGYVVGDTVYRQGSIGGADYLFAVTTVTHTR